MNPLLISYGVHQSPFGLCLIAVAEEGICQLSFLEDGNEEPGIELIQKTWPEATLHQDQKVTATLAQKIFATKPSEVDLLVKGTDFQMKVWEALLKIPKGSTSTYAEIARVAGSPKASRAVGSACGKNQIAFLIPCHRVLTSTGKLGGYRWGIVRKKMMLEKEGAAH